MKQKMVLGLRNALLLLVPPLLFYAVAFFVLRAPLGPKAEGGVLDLRDQGERLGRGLALSGQWVCYPGQLLDSRLIDQGLSPGLAREVPDEWRDPMPGVSGGLGVVSYRLKVLLPPDSRDLALSYLTVSTSFELDVNGRTIATVGNVSKDPRLAKPAFRPGLVTLGDQATGAVPPDSLDIVVRVANYSYRTGGIWQAPVLGSRSRLERHSRLSSLFEVALFAAILTMCVNALFFAIFRGRDGSYLGFAVFAASVALRSLVTNDYPIMGLLPDLPFTLLVKAEYLTAFLPLCTGILFVASLFPRAIKRHHLAVLLGPALAIVACVFIMPLRLMTQAVFAFYAVSLLIMLILSVVIVRQALRLHSPSSWLMLSGGVLLLSATLNDILHSSFGFSGAILTPSALTCFVFILALVLAKRYSRALDDSRLLLAEKEILIKEVHHRVKNSLQIVSSIIKLKAFQCEDDFGRQFLGELRQRIRAISLVHERLYTLGEEESINASDYFPRLCEELEASFLPGGWQSRVRLELADFRLATKDCMDLGLIAVELVTNAFRHSAKEDPRAQAPGAGDLCVRVFKDGPECRLEVEDSGPGFPPGFKPESVSSMGYKMILGILGKHRGQLIIGYPGHGLVKVRMPLSPV